MPRTSTFPASRPPVKISAVREYALSLEAVTEEPHHNFSSFRVRGKIFVTVPPDEKFIHVFVGEGQREKALAVYPAFIEKLFWGGKARGLRIELEKADPVAVKALVSKAYEERVLKDAGSKKSKTAKARLKL